jgi:hypothetical protein
MHCRSHGALNSSRPRPSSRTPSLTSVAGRGGGCSGTDAGLPPAAAPPATAAAAAMLARVPPRLSLFHEPNKCAIWFAFMGFCADVVPTSADRPGKRPSLEGSKGLPLFDGVLEKQYKRWKQLGACESRAEVVPPARRAMRPRLMRALAPEPTAPGPFQHVQAGWWSKEHATRPPHAMGIWSKQSRHSPGDRRGAAQRSTGRQPLETATEPHQTISKRRRSKYFTETLASTPPVSITPGERGSRGRCRLGPGAAAAHLAPFACRSRICSLEPSFVL